MSNEETESQKTELDTVRERLAFLESIQSKGQSANSKIPNIVSIIALFISLVTASFTAYDKIVLESERREKRNRAELADIVQTLNSLDQQIAETETKDLPPELALSIRSSILNQKSALSAAAEEIVEELQGEISAGDYITLANARLNANDPKTAIKYLKEALKRSISETYEVEAYRLLAQAQFTTMEEQYISDGRASFEKSLQLLSTIKSGFYKAARQANILSDWVIAESVVNNCVLAEEKSEKLRQVFQTGSIPNKLASELVSKMERGLGEFSRCNINLSWYKGQISENK